MKNDNIDEIIDGLKGKKSGEDAEKFLKSRLSSEQSQRLNEILGNKDELKRLLSSEKAKELFKRFGKTDGE